MELPLGWPNAVAVDDVVKVDLVDMGVVVVLVVEIVVGAVALMVLVALLEVGLLLFPAFVPCPMCVLFCWLTVGAAVVTWSSVVAQVVDIF